MKLLLAAAIFISAHSISAQTKNNEFKANLDKVLSEQSQFTAECETKIKAAQIKEFGKVSPKIAGECERNSSGCPIRIVKPIYPETARRRGLFGAVKVEIIIDETGKTVFAKAFQGKKIFYRNAELAALLSLYSPKIICGKAVLQRKYLVYNFRPN